jgi:D-beta-D-heptose 7-phosphate kinase/D-beta-D-heptose 1-phosphate adenosyltransferase
MEKLISLKRLIGRLKTLKKRGKSIVFTNGCFDIIHAGHVRYLKKARALGDILVVGLNDDASTRTIKGKGRPIVPEKERAEILSALSSVDFVVMFKEPTPIRLIEAIRPDFLVKGADWKRGRIVGEEVVKSYGGRVARIRLVEGRSTTNIIKSVLRLHKKDGSAEETVNRVPRLHK